VYLELAFLVQIDDFQPAAESKHGLRKSIELPAFGELIYPACRIPQLD
jgi:hypothetical protein